MLQVIVVDEGCSQYSSLFADDVLLISHESANESGTKFFVLGTHYEGMVCQEHNKMAPLHFHLIQERQQLQDQPATKYWKFSWMESDLEEWGGAAIREALENVYASGRQTITRTSNGYLELM